MTETARSFEGGGEFCPFVGLSWFQKTHKDYFFGRDLDAAIAADNLLASPISVLYGASGVGKSSLINVGLERAFDKIGVDSTLIIYRQWQDPGFLTSLKKQIIEQSEMAAAIDEQTELVDIIQDVIEKTSRPFALILDQFEEYFLYQQGERAQQFEMQLERLDQLTDELDSHVMIGVRDDRLHLLNRLKLRLPGIFDNAMELNHLDDAAINEAITGPIDVYNQRYRGPGDAIKVSPDFVEELKRQLRKASKNKERQDKTPQLIELPYLQLALEKIWEAETKNDADEQQKVTTLSGKTLNDKLLGVEQIVRRHLNDVLQDFDQPTQLACARAFDWLVTPSGSKIAHQRADLVRFGTTPRDESQRFEAIKSALKLFGIEETLQDKPFGEVLDLLADEGPVSERQGKSARRILRSVPSPNNAEERSYEIFHDVLGQPIIEWKELIKNKRAKSRERLRLLLVSFIAAVFLFVAAVAYLQSRQLAVANQDLKLKEISLLATTSEAQRAAGRPVQAVKLGLDALQKELEEKGHLTPATKRALSSALYANHERLRLSHHLRPVLAVAFHPNGQLLATGSADGTVVLADLDNGNIVLTLDHEHPVPSLAFSADGDRLATGSKTGDVRIWDLTADPINNSPKSPLALLKAHEKPTKSVAFSPDGKFLATGSEDFTAKIWDLATNKTVALLDRHQSAVRSVAFDPDNQYLATSADDNQVHIWSQETYEIAATLEGHEASVRSVAFSPNGQRLVSGSWDGTAIVWDLNSDEENQISSILIGDGLPVRSVAFGPFGARVATGSADGTVRLWDLRTGRALLTLSGHRSETWSVAFSPDGTSLATASADKTARIWSLEKNDYVTMLVGHDERVWDVAFSPDGKELATASGDDSVVFWNVETLELVRSLDVHRGSVRSIAFSPKGRFLATGSSDKTVGLVDLQNGDVTTLGHHDAVIREVAFDPDGKHLATSSDDETTIIWNMATRAPHATLRGHDGRVLSASFSPDGKTLATGGTDFVARIWDVLTGVETGKLEGHLDDVESTAFSHDGEHIATSSRDGAIMIWDAASLKLLAEFNDGRGAVSTVAFSNDGETLASASFDGTALIWDLETHQVISILEGHSAPVRSVSLSPDGKFLATSSDDTTARIWRIFEEVPELVSFTQKQLEGLTP